MQRITLLAEKISNKNWEAFLDAYSRLNTATPVEIEIETLQRALLRAGVGNPDQLPELLKNIHENRYLCLCFDIIEGRQVITFEGTNIPHKIKDPAPPI